MQNGLIIEFDFVLEKRAATGFVLQATSIVLERVHGFQIRGQRAVAVALIGEHHGLQKIVARTVGAGETAGLFAL
jgi:hypothetical protein